ncbi:MAG: hypothetical protein Q8L66_16020 [Caulobacter sp.]|nr:hypothetical protein [Caulobacter sp.]
MSGFLSGEYGRDIIDQRNRGDFVVGVVSIRNLSEKDVQYSPMARFQLTNEIEKDLFLRQGA